VTRAVRKYVLDTHLFIHAFRDPIANEALQRFHRAFAPFEHLSVIVAQELRAGVKQPVDRKSVERNVLRVFGRAGRTITPSAGPGTGPATCLRTWRGSTDWKSPGFRRRSPMRFCWRCQNERDFSRIRRFISFEFMMPWPA
jgi:hypothetical protein